MLFPKLFSKISIAAVVFSSISTGSAFAATYYCDNDRAASQYPQCDTSYSGTWQYRSGNRSDWNGDHRLGKSGNGYYDWKFKNITGNYATLYAWLANDSFTNPRAEYSVDTDIIAYVNQNTAPSGWNRVGRHYLSGSTAFFQVDNGTPNGATGADIIRIETSNEFLTLNSSSAKEQAYHTNPTIASLQQKMLNAVDNYKQIRGNYTSYFSNIASKETVQFIVDQAKKTSKVSICDQSGNTIEQITTATTIAKRNAKNKPWQKQTIAKVSPTPSIRHYINLKGQAVFTLRPTTSYASDVTFPQNYAFWLRHASNHIITDATLLGRPVTIVSGKHDAYFANKLKATEYKMWIDNETGVLLRLEGRNAQGKLSYFIHVNEIHIN
jgi:hypothetical protein